MVTEVGAGLRAFAVSGRPYLETFDPDTRPPLGAGTVLVPWPNRTAAGQWSWQGQPQQLDAERTGPRQRHPRAAAAHLYQVGERAADTITLQARVAAQPGWPVPLATSVRYAVGPEGLTVTHTVRNIGAEPVPFGVGAHPYLRAG